MTEFEQNTGLDIVIFGGGGGGSVMTRGFVETIPHAEIATIVPTGDSGSKTGELREIFGGPAIGDARKNLGAVASGAAAEFFDDRVARFGPEATADTVTELNERFLRMLEEGGQSTRRPAAILADAAEHVRWLPNGLRGHTYTNLILNALRLEHRGRLTDALKEMGQWVDIPKNVTILPVTEESHNVVMHDRVTGTIRIGEGEVDEYAPPDPEQVDVWLEAGPMANRLLTDRRDVARYLEARPFMRAPMATAEVIGRTVLSRWAVLAPGSPWTSHAPMLMTDGIRHALCAQRERGGEWAVVANLIEEKPGLTLGIHLRTVHAAAGRPITLLVHNTATDGLPEGAIPLHYDPEAFAMSDGIAIGGAFVDSHLVEKSPNDPIAHLRSPGRHNIWKVMRVFEDRILTGLGNRAAGDLVAA